MILRSYQQEIIDKSKHLPSLGLFMGTGTGKTITSLERFKLNPTSKLLIICPKSVVSQWTSVINEHYPEYRVLEFPKTASNSEKKNHYLIQNYRESDIIIVNFEIVYKLTNLLVIIDNDYTIIVDESHRIKSYGTNRSPVKQTRAVLSLSYQTNYKMILTATPTQANYGGFIDFYTQLFFLGYINMTLKEFKDRYVVEKQQQVRGRPYPIKVITGYKNIEELEKLLSLTCFYYSPKLGDFPPEHIKINVERAKSYARTKREMMYKEIVLDNSARKRIGMKTLAGGRIAGMDSFNQRYFYDDNTHKIDWLKEFLEDTDEVVTIFYQYNVERDLILQLLHKIGKTYVVINGETEDKYNEINNKDYDVVVGQYQAMSESLDGLQYKSHIMVMYSLPESSLTYKQALGRIDRIGQEKVPMYYYLVMEKTIDEAIYDLIQQKIEFSEETLDKLNIWED
jgi:SNF2 family DNA or RNA helicase